MIASNLVATSIGLAMRMRGPHVSVAAPEIKKAKIGAKYHFEVTEDEALKYESALTMIV
jgi:hypothetical protein